MVIAGMASLINIRSAMQEWQNSICITFKERSLEEDYIEFAYEGGYGIDKLNLSLYIQLLSRVLSDETTL